MESKKNSTPMLLPDGLTESQKLDIYLEAFNAAVQQIDKLKKDVENLTNKINKYRGKLETQSSKNIEIIGIFSAILALLIIDVNIIKSIDSFLSAILLIVGLTCSMSIFILLVHFCFSPDGKAKVGKFFWIPNTILIILICLGFLFYFFNIDINKIRAKDIENGAMSSVTEKK